MKTKNKYPCVLTIAGSDSSGGAGIQADLKTISALGCYGMSAISALTAQNTCGVRATHHIPPEFLKSQMNAVLEDIFPDAIKIGMVCTVENAIIIADVLRHYPAIPVVFDPVMVATSGEWLMNESGALQAVDELIPFSTLLTPNLDEVSLLSGIKIQNVEQMSIAGEKIMTRGCAAVLIKGGHLKSEWLRSILIQKNAMTITFNTEKIKTKNLHGSGCTLSTAIACYLAKNIPLAEAVSLGTQYVHQAIYYGKHVSTGMGNGPLNHFFNPQKLMSKSKK